MMEIWEAGLAGARVSRAVRMLEAAGHAAGRAATLSIGRRDALVLDLRTRLFGRRMEVVLSCPACAEELEIGFDTAVLQTDDSAEPSVELETSAAGHTVRFRLPHTGDLLAITGAACLAAARAALLARCVRHATDESGRKVPADALPGEVIEAVTAAMEEADPQAVAPLAVSCPSCGHAWTEPFDAAEFLWHELDGAAGRVLTDVHLLAGAYGWSEAEILAMSAVRRERYLGMVRQ
jgi:hypothetical protein